MVILPQPSFSRSRVKYRQKYTFQFYSRVGELKPYGRPCDQYQEQNQRDTASDANRAFSRPRSSSTQFDMHFRNFLLK